MHSFNTLSKERLISRQLDSKFKLQKPLNINHTVDSNINRSFEAQSHQHDITNQASPEIHTTKLNFLGSRLEKIVRPTTSVSNNATQKQTYRRGFRNHSKMSRNKEIHLSSGNKHMKTQNLPKNNDLVYKTERQTEVKNDGHLQTNIESV